MTDLHELAALNSELLKLIECPACLDYMDHMIYICVAGHSCCGKCRKTMARCPICRGKMTFTRNCTLESLAQSLFYPCKFDGCSKHISVTEYDEHALSCNFRLYKCLLKSDGANCSWSGQYHEIMEHANKKHESKAWMQEENLDRWKEGLDDNDVQLIQAYDKLFYIFRSAICEDSMMHWAVQYIGSAEEAIYYGYVLSIYCEHSHRDLKFSEICHDDRKTMKQMIDTGKCVGIPMNTLRTFKNSYSSVCFTVKIKEFKR